MSSARAGKTAASRTTCNTENPLRLFFFERWQDEAALRVHFAVPASRDFVKALRSLIVETSGTRIWRAEAIER